LCVGSKEKKHRKRQDKTFWTEWYKAFYEFEAINEEIKFGKCLSYFCLKAWKVVPFKYIY
jgi:hypothetical protein